MLRQSPSRNQRSKGVKVKQVLQICVLLAVCFWLIYQVKHSRDKKKEFDENGAKKTVNTRRGDGILNFGRKDLNPRVEEATRKVEKHEEEEEVAEEETEGEEEEDNKNDEEEKIEEREDEGRGGGDDEIDEHEQEKSDSEVDREEEFVDEEKQREEGVEKEVEEKDVEDKVGISELHEASLEDHDHDGGAGNTHEAREEQYKADDASSAVTHDTQTTTTENENGTVENSNENAEANILEEENQVNSTEKINVDENTRRIKGEDDETAENGFSFNSTANASLITTEVSTEFHDLSLQNETETTTELTQAQNITLEESNISNISSDSKQHDSNSTISITPENGEAVLGRNSNSLSNLEFVASEQIIRPNTSTEAGDASESSTTKENNGTDELLGLGKAENLYEVEHDHVDSSVTVEGKEARTDLDTLPEITTEEATLSMLQQSDVL